MLRLVIDVTTLQLVLRVLIGWLDCREREAVAYLIEENRYCGASLADVACVSPTTIAAGWPPERTESAVRLCGRSPRSRRRTPCCGGIVS